MDALEHKRLCLKMQKILDNLPDFAKFKMVIEDSQPGSYTIRLPLEPNKNHFNSMYAGSLFSLGDALGGLLFMAVFDQKK